MNAKITSFEDLECWQFGRDLRLFVSRQVVSKLPPDEKYRLGDQLIRSSRSITANIAEGYGRNHFLDNAKFCRNAMGSCCEVLDHLICAHDERWIGDDLLLSARTRVETVRKVLNGYIGYLKRAANSRSTE